MEKIKSGFPTVLEIAEKVSGDKITAGRLSVGALGFSVGYNSSAQIKTEHHANMNVLGYWLVENIFACIMYRSARRTFAYCLSNEPLRGNYGKKSAYELSEDEAAKFIEERGGVFVEGFDLAELLRKTRGEVIGEFEIDEYTKYRQDAWDERSKKMFKIYVGQNSLSIYDNSERYGTCCWKRLNVNEFSSVYKLFVESIKQESLEEVKKKMEEETEKDVDANGGGGQFYFSRKIIYVRRGELSEEVLGKIAKMAVLNDL